MQVRNCLFIAERHKRNRKVNKWLYPAEIVFLLFSERCKNGNDFNKINASMALQVLSFRSCVIVFQVVTSLRFPGFGGDDITGTMLRLQIGLPDILAQDSKADQLDTPKQADNTDG